MSEVLSAMSGVILGLLWVAGRQALHLQVQTKGIAAAAQQSPVAAASTAEMHSHLGIVAWGQEECAAARSLRQRPLPGQTSDGLQQAHTCSARSHSVK